jgi:hypothetical protein
MNKAGTDREIDRALARGRRRAVTEPRAERAHYERRTGRAAAARANGRKGGRPRRAA